MTSLINQKWGFFLIRHRYQHVTSRIMSTSIRVTLFQSDGGKLGHHHLDDSNTNQKTKLNALFLGLKDRSRHAYVPAKRTNRRAFNFRWKVGGVWWTRCPMDPHPLHNSFLCFVTSCWFFPGTFQRWCRSFPSNAWVIASLLNTSYSQVIRCKPHWHDYFIRGNQIYFSGLTAPSKGNVELWRWVSSQTEISAYFSCRCCGQRLDASQLHGQLLTDRPSHNCSTPHGERCFTTKHRENITKGHSNSTCNFQQPTWLKLGLFSGMMFTDVLESTRETRKKSASRTNLSWQLKEKRKISFQKPHQRCRCPER